MPRDRETRVNFISKLHVVLAVIEVEIIILKVLSRFGIEYKALDFIFMRENLTVHNALTLHVIMCGYKPNCTAFIDWNKITRSCDQVDSSSSRRPRILTQTLCPNLSRRDLHGHITIPAILNIS